jgi:uncharacterized protein YmfQ (DUF2313 family)
VSIFADLLRSLLPPVAYDPSGPRLSAWIDAEAAALQAARDGGDTLLARMHPATADTDVSSWERLYALTPAPSDSLAKRIQVVLAKMGELGGISRAYFVRLAASQGYGITISEPRAFRCGISRCGERLYGEDVVFVWDVTINTRPVGGDDAALKALFNDLKPAHTQCDFVE